jgi:hypothetical protein
MVTIITIDCAWLFSRRPTRLAETGTHLASARLNSIHHPTQLPCAPQKLVRTPVTQPRQHHTHCSVCKVVLRARASARRCAPASSMLFERRLCGLCEQRDRNSMITVITIDCVWLFSRRDRPCCPHWHPFRVSATPIPFTTLLELRELPCAPHKIVRTPVTQPRQHHTHCSVCKVVLRARASARCCTPASPILLSERLSGWCEQRDRISMATLITIDCVWLFCRRPTRLA